MRAIVAMLMAMTTAVAAADAPSGSASTRPDSVQPTAIKAACRNGQTFVTWNDPAQGEAGSRFRYSLYRSDRPITPDNLAQAELCYPGVPNNSAKLIGHAYFMKDRLNPARPTCIIEEGGQPLPMWSGLAVRTVARDGKSYYAIVATDEKHQPLSKVVPGESATAEPVDEKVAPPQPIRQAGKGRPAVWSGRKGLPLTISLHGSTSSGPKAAESGELFLYFATAEMGWRDGLAGVFTVTETPPGAGGPRLVLSPIDAIENPSGNGVIETCWFGYFCIPQGASHGEPRVYPFTERRLAWMIRWAMANYAVDPLRVFSVGQSMGGMASTQFSFRHPELFAAVYPRLQRVRQSWLPAVLPGLTAINKGRYDKPTLMEDGKTDYFVHMDSVRWAGEHHEDLPFYGWCCGRHDWVEPWKAYIEMVKVLTANHHGFAMAWANTGHDSETPRVMVKVNKYYGPEKFALNASYPAFGHSSIDDDMGSGELVELADPKAAAEFKQGQPAKELPGPLRPVEKKVLDLKDGATEGGINLGFAWSEVVDQPDKWSARISNELAKGEMTVDVTPRRCQQFKPKSGDKLKWTSSAGGGEVVADEFGLVTVPKLKLNGTEATVLTITR